MLDLATLTAHRDALLAARYSGEKRVRFETSRGQEEVEYKTDPEMAAALADLERRIASMTPGAAPVTTIRIHSSKGT